jgi:hypothetical protein
MACVVRGTPQGSRFNSKVVSIAILSAVTQFGCDSVSVSGGGGAPLTPPVLNLTSVDGEPMGQLILDKTGRAYFGTTAFSFVASCVRGIGSVGITVNGTRIPAVSCPFDATVSFTWTAPGDGPYDFVFSSTTPGGPGGTTQFHAFVDSSAPPPPTITAPSPVRATHGPFTVTGTFPTGIGIQTIDISGGPSGGAMTVDAVAGTFSYVFNVVGGTTYNLAFSSQNYLGLVSAATRFVVYDSSRMFLNGFMASGGPPQTSTNQLTLFTGAPVLAAPLVSTDKAYIGIPAGARQGP